jgi:glycosyltransferase involved in cell wall biosynthesis
LRDQLGKQAAEYAKFYSWDKIALRVKTVYEEMLENKGKCAD